MSAEVFWSIMAVLAPLFIVAGVAIYEQVLRVRDLRAMSAEGWDRYHRAWWEVLTLRDQVEEMRARFGTQTEEAHQRGYELGYRWGHAEGYDEGERVGSADGYDTGYSDGYEMAHSVYYERGFRDGYKQNLTYDEGFSAGREKGYVAGCEEGYERGRNDGRAEGDQHGHDAGYERGYGDGYEEGYGKGRDGEARVRSVVTEADTSDPLVVAWLNQALAAGPDRDECPPEGMVRPTI